MQSEWEEWVSAEAWNHAIENTEKKTHMKIVLLKTTDNPTHGMRDAKIWKLSTAI